LYWSVYLYIKGIVHPKNENFVITYSSCSKPVCVWTQKKIFERIFSE